MWNDIIGLRNSVTGPWLLAGDFHSVLSFEDRIHGAPITGNQRFSLLY